eukprot:13008823-Alexandrium_andersonii.AAC.1
MVVPTALCPTAMWEPRSLASNLTPHLPSQALEVLTPEPGPDQLGRGHGIGLVTSNTRTDNAQILHCAL